MWALREANWKLVITGSDTTELFDLASDPYEKTNLADRYPDRVRELHQRLSEERGRDGEAVRGAAVDKGIQAAPAARAPSAIRKWR
jgi:arylsulfatase A-like enzyme